jgi:N-acylneuraminate cytidylyltransferase
LKTLAIIPARGGSKRIPRKNIKEFLGKPIIAYSIEVALTSGLFDEVMVSTDDEEIAAIAKQYGANIPFMRNPNTANDYSTTMDVLNEVTLDYKNKLNIDFEYVCCIYATAPLILKEHLVKGYKLLTDMNYHSVYPIVSYGYPVWRGLRINEGGRTEMVWMEFIHTRSQDLEPVYHDAGQWYWYKTNKIKNTLFTDNSASIILNELDVQDIDSATDWKLAELKYELRLQSSK